MTYFWLWWQGYIIIRFKGPGLERLLNKVAGLNIMLYQVERLAADVLIARLPIHEFYRLRHLLWNSQINVAILERRGFPFLARKFKIRIFLGVGLILSSLIIVYFSSFIWFIEVTGTESLSPAELRVAIEDIGLHAGVSRKTLVPIQVEAALIERFPILAWAQVSVKGVKVQINLAEKAGLETKYESAGNVYAQEDGLITEILVLRGTPQVHEGDTVRAGDLLISGLYYDVYGKKQFGKAQGIVRARVWYQAIGEAPLTKWEPLETGREHRQFIITVGSFSIPIGRSYSEETHLKEIKEWCLSLGSAMVPLRWTKIDYKEVQYIPVSIPTEEAEKTARRIAWESMFNRGIKRNEVSKERWEKDSIFDQDGIRVTLWAEVEEDIGQFLSE